MTIARKIGGSWSPCTAWRKIGGTWKAATVWRNVGGVWKTISVLFTPDGGTASGSSVSPADASVVLSCSIPATWTFTLPSGVTASISSGVSATSITFSRSAVGFRTLAVTGDAGGQTRNFTVELDVESGA